MICWTRLVAVTGRDEEKGILRMAVNGVSRRHFFFGSLLAGAVPTGGFGSTQSLRSMGYKSPNELLNIASVGSAGRPYEDMIGCSSENIVAIADVDDSVAVRAHERWDKAVHYRDFRKRSEERRVGKECRSRWSPDH